MTKNITSGATQPSSSAVATTTLKASTVSDLSGGSIPHRDERYGGRIYKDGRWRRNRDFFVKPCAKCEKPVFPGKLRCTVTFASQPKFCPSCTERSNRVWLSPSPQMDPKHLRDALAKPSRWAHLHVTEEPEELEHERYRGTPSINHLDPVDEWDQEICR